MCRQMSIVLNFWLIMDLRNFTKLRGTLMLLRIWMFLSKREILLV